MSKAPSAETQLRTAKRDIKDLRSELTMTKAALQGTKIRCAIAETAEKEWKMRFDALLKITEQRGGDTSA